MGNIDIPIFPNQGETEVPPGELEEVRAIREGIEKMNIPDEYLDAVMETRRNQLFLGISSEIREKIAEETRKGNLEEAQRLRKCAPMIIQFRTSKRLCMEFGLTDPDTGEF